MAVQRCPHKRTVTGVIHAICRATVIKSLFTAHSSRVSVCTQCGHTELNCEAHQDVFTWLGGLSASHEESPGNGEVRHSRREIRRHSRRE